uniref:Homeobox-leucine zipper protein MERISTEM L1-like n=1 Tax=Cicer arietinum TaxID=3827 RepID=A0A1S2XZ98_CICAR|nr:homeobox-leucine zipper protein MERISTEM L1-like [Cicer arietinum]
MCYSKSKVRHPQPQKQQLTTSSTSDSERTNENEDSGNEAPPSTEDQNHNKQPKKRVYKRHTQPQIREMEAFFKNNPHPDERQRKQLGRELGLGPMQIKFWFQNKRTQMKVQMERQEKYFLKEENERLRAEIEMYKEAINKATCPKCECHFCVDGMSFHEYHHLKMIEYARLKAQAQMMAGTVPIDVGNHEGCSYSNIGQMSAPSFEVGSGSGNYSNSIMIEEMRVDSNNLMIVELAVVAMEELTTLALAGSPLWIPSNYKEILNEAEYTRFFPNNVIGPKLIGLKSEASRESVTVPMNSINLIEVLMDVNQWSTMFYGIVSNAMTIDVLSPGVSGNYNGALQVMSADFQVPSPLVSARENHFIRYCKQYQQGVWAVVDVSLDHLCPSSSSTTRRSRRRPSGCLIQELQNGCSKVTWVEHVEVDESTVASNQSYKSLITSGLAFGAIRWVASLDRQCERLAISMTINIPPAADHFAMNSLQRRKSLMRLTDRMKVYFSTVAGSSIPNCWEVLTSNSNDVRVMIKRSIREPGTNTGSGLILSAGTSLWLPVLPKRLFDFLRSQNSRSEWDIISIGGIIQEMAHIPNGQDPANCVSLIRVKSADCSQNNMVLLQENSTDSTGSYVIYAPVDYGAMNVVMNGGDPDCVVMLPSGFVILPDGVPLNNGGGCLLTISFQILIDSNPNATIQNGSVQSVIGLIKNTVERIKIALAFDRTP